MRVRPHDVDRVGRMVPPPLGATGHHPPPALRKTSASVRATGEGSDASDHAPGRRTNHPRAKQHAYDYCILSENIAYQYSSTELTTAALAQEFFDGWQRSPEHRKNMLNADVTETGVAVAQSEETGYYYAVQMFGRPSSKRIEFQIVNHSDAVIRYQLGTRPFSLPPRHTRTHQRCGAAELTFQWPDGPDMAPK